MRRFPLLFLGVMVAIVVVDWWLGGRAEYLNAYEIVRRTFCLPVPQVTETYIIGQQAVGRFALAWAWLLWLVETSVAAMGLIGIATGAKFLVFKFMEVGR